MICVLFLSMSSILICIATIAHNRTGVIRIFLQHLDTGELEAINVLTDASDQDVRLAMHEIGIKNPITFRFNGQILPINTQLSESGIGDQSVLRWSSTFLLYIQKKWTGSKQMIVEFPAYATKNDVFALLCNRKLCNMTDYIHVEMEDVTGIKHLNV